MKKFYSEKQLLSEIYANDLQQIKLLNYKCKRIENDYNDLLLRYNNLKKIYNYTLQLLRKEKEKNDNNV